MIQNTIRTKLSALAGVMSLAFVAMPASAAIDTSEALAAVTEATTFITTVGLAVLAMHFVAKGIKWARRAG